MTGLVLCRPSQVHGVLLVLQTALLLNWLGALAAVVRAAIMMGAGIADCTTVENGQPRGYRDEELRGW